MNINIYGSTGVIGKKTLKLISKYFPNIKINLLVANKNYKTLINQIKFFKPRYVYLNDHSKIKFIKEIVKYYKIKILDSDELNYYLKNSKSDLSILAISGYKSLNFLDQIVKNTDNLGILSKEAIVSAGHLFKKNNYFKKTNIFPLDSEHFSIFDQINKLDYQKNIMNIIITASGGPFYKKKFSSLKNIKFNQAIKHPKWKMGYKNSIDSATLVNKCLEVIEAHYLFDIPYSKIDIKIHPEALVHSIINYKNFVSNLIMFKNDMSIPIFNFLLKSNDLDKKNNLIYNNEYHKYSFSNLEFLEVKNNIFPIYKLFNNIDKSNPSNIIKFNVGNEYAVNLFKKNLIKYTDIYKIINKVVSLNLYYPLKTIKDILKYHEDLEQVINKKINLY